MIAFVTIVIFFLVLILIYPAAAATVALCGWLRKRRAIQSGATGETLAKIEETTDRLKSRWFIITLALAFFVIAPFLAMLMLFK